MNEDKKSILSLGERYSLSSNSNLKKWLILAVKLPAYPKVKNSYYNFPYCSLLYILLYKSYNLKAFYRTRSLAPYYLELSLIQFIEKFLKIKKVLKLLYFFKFNFYKSYFYSIDGIFLNLD